MGGLIAGTSVLSLELVATIIVISMIVGAIDAARQPGWAWRRAEESKSAWIVLVALVPLVGLGMYLRTARPAVASIAAAGRAASLPFEHFGNDVDSPREQIWPAGMVAPPERFVKVGATTAADGEIRLVGGGSPAPVPTPSPAHTPTSGGGAGDGFMGTGGTALRSAPAPVSLSRTYRPTQRTSLPVPTPDRNDPASSPSVPAGWKADPTGRHQFRYWGGTRWTDNVADNGEQSTDAPAS
jgi:hypothetical protein